MKQLHLHLLSLDFDSPALKRPRHWAIFNSAFLVPPARWAAELEQRGRVAVDVEAERAGLKERRLSCPLTGQQLADVLAAKEHVRSAAYLAAVAGIDSDIVFL